MVFSSPWPREGSQRCQEKAAAVGERYAVLDGDAEAAFKNAGGHVGGEGGGDENPVGGNPVRTGGGGAVFDSGVVSQEPVESWSLMVTAERKVRGDVFRRVKSTGKDVRLHELC